MNCFRKCLRGRHKGRKKVGRRNSNQVAYVETTSRGHLLEQFKTLISAPRDNDSRLIEVLSANDW